MCQSKVVFCFSVNSKTKFTFSTTITGKYSLCCVNLKLELCFCLLDFNALKLVENYLKTTYIKDYFKILQIVVVFGNMVGSFYLKPLSVKY